MLMNVELELIVAPLGIRPLNDDGMYRPVWVDEFHTSSSRLKSAFVSVTVMPAPVGSLALRAIIRSSRPLAVFFAWVPRVEEPSLAAYQMRVRAYAAPTPTS